MDKQCRPRSDWSSLIFVIPSTSFGDDVVLIKAKDKNSIFFTDVRIFTVLFLSFDRRLNACGRIIKIQ